MAHNALIFYVCFPFKQHNVHEQALLCHGRTSTALLSHQLPLPETLNRQTPVLLCELAFYSRVFSDMLWSLSSLTPFYILSPRQGCPSFFHLLLSSVSICPSSSVSSDPLTKSPPPFSTSYILISNNTPRFLFVHTLAHLPRPCNKLFSFFVLLSPSCLGYSHALFNNQSCALCGFHLHQITTVDISLQHFGHCSKIQP